jgi:hypothetical protein
VEHGGEGVVSVKPGPAAAGVDRRETTAQVPVSADWLRLARLARTLSWITLAWMGVEGGVAIGAAVLAGSVALLGFGLDSGIEAIASIIVIWRFTGTRLASATSERRAQRLVAISFFLLAPYIAVDAVRGLLAGDRAETSIAGLLAEHQGAATYYRINEACVDCFPTAADVVMGHPVPARPGSTDIDSCLSIWHSRDR